MQQLHLVGFTTDHKGLILGARRGAKEGGYVLMVDRALVEQIEDLLRLQADEGSGQDVGRSTGVNGRGPLLRRPKAESRLTPREVQALLRAGQSVGEIAETAGMSEDWVARFAPPVLAEQAQVVERASRVAYSRPRVGPSMQPLAESVAWNLAERGVILTGADAEDAWSAYQQPDGGWVVRVSYVLEKRRQHADWAVDAAQGRVRALNRLASELGFVEQGRRRPAALPPASPPTASAAQRAVAPPPAKAPPPAVVSPPTTPFAANANALSKGRIADSNTPRPTPPRRPSPRHEPPRLPPSTPPAGREPRGSAPAPTEGDRQPPRRSRPLTPARDGDPHPAEPRRAGDRPSSAAGRSAPPTGRQDAASAPPSPPATRLGSGSPIPPPKGPETGSFPPSLRESLARPGGSGEPRVPRPRDPSAPRRPRPLRAPPRGAGLTPGGDEPDQESGARAQPRPSSIEPVGGEGAPGTPAVRSRPTAQRKASTAELFGVGRAARPEPAAPAVPAPPSGPREDRIGEDLTATGQGGTGQREATADDEWLPDAESHAPPGRPARRVPRSQRGQPGGDESRPANPITAPVPVIVIGDFEDVAPGEGVSIRAGQAGSVEEGVASEEWPGAEPPAGAPGPDDRQARSGRLRLRRRPPGDR